jgi:hypothetical protein
VFLGLCAIALLVLTPLWGGSLSRLAAVRVRGLWLAVAALVLQVLVISVFTSLPRDVAVAGHLASYVLLAVVLWRNRALAGVPLVALGVAANAVTIAVNGGTLPASTGALRAAGIHLRPGFDNSGLVAHPHLAWLGDTMVTPAWLPMRNMLSIGDLLLLAGAAVLVVVATRRRVVGESEHGCAPATRAGRPAPAYEGLHRR